MDQISNFSFSHYPAVLLSAIPFCINIGLFIYVFFFLPKNKLNTTFSVFLITLCIWQLSNTMVRLSGSEEMVKLWYDMLNPLSHFMAPTALHFTLLFSNSRWFNRWTLTVIYVPALFFMVTAIGGFNHYEISPSSFWKWSVFHTDTPFNYISAYWSGLLGWSILVILLRFVIRNKGVGNVGKQAILITIGFAIPIIQGIVTEILFPYLFSIPVIPVTSLFMSVFSVCVVIARTRYNLFSYSPRHIWEAIVSSMNEGILIVDNNDIIQYTNRKLCEMTGYSPDELIGQCAMDVFLERSNKEKIISAIKRREKRISDKYEISLRTKNGQRICCLVSGSPYTSASGRVIGSVGIMTDITDMKVAETRLQQSEDRYRKFIARSLSAIYWIDPQTGIVMDANPAFFKLLGYSRKDIGRLTTYEIATASRDEIDSLIRQVIEEKGQNAGERTWRTKDDVIVNVLVSTACIEQNGKKIIFVIANDITQRIVLEKKLLQKIQDLNALFYRLSHDLRSPLASVAGLINIARQDVQGKESISYLEMIDQCILHLDRILLELIDIATITQGSVKKVPVNLKAEICHVFETFNNDPRYSEINFSSHINISGPIFTDRRLLIPIIQNLISNAIKYSDPEKEQKMLMVNAGWVGDQICITVTDNGIGIPASARTEIFNMFYKAHENSNGTGLGLFIVRSAVEKLGGEIYCQSDEGKGSTFTVLLPIKEKRVKCQTA